MAIALLAACSGEPNEAKPGEAKPDLCVIAVCSPDGSFEACVEALRDHDDGIVRLGAIVILRAKLSLVPRVREPASDGEVAGEVVEQGGKEESSSLAVRRVHSMVVRQRSRDDVLRRRRAIQHFLENRLGAPRRGTPPGHFPFASIGVEDSRLSWRTEEGLWVLDDTGVAWKGRPFTVTSPGSISLDDPIVMHQLEHIVPAAKDGAIWRELGRFLARQ